MKMENQVALITGVAGGIGEAVASELSSRGVKALAAVIHPGFTDTRMVQALEEEYIKKNILPATQLKRLIRPQEIANSICFMISNAAVSGELWADAAWHPCNL
jgi:3-oxoacyl-[acyl-carrier protein] reductase